MVNGSLNRSRFLWILLPCAVVLSLAAWLRGAEYDEQYTLFLTAGVPRPDWPLVAFPAGLARVLQSGNGSLAGIAHDLRVTDVHPPLYFWLVSLWRAVLGHDLFVARLLSVALGLVALTLTGVIARLARLPPVWAMLLTLGCYGFTYTSAVARGFALAQVLLLGGVVCLLLGRRGWHFALAGVLFGAATLSNYLAMFTAGACLLAVGLEVVWPRPCRSRDIPSAVGVRASSRPCRVTPVDQQGRGISGPGGPSPRQAVAAALGFLAFIPWDLWWFLAQRGSRDGQFPPFSWGQSLARLAVRFTGDILGGLPLYVHGAASTVLAAALGLLLVWLLGRIVWRWRHIGLPRGRLMFALAALAPALGLLLLGAIFNNIPIEVRYLTFSTPFVGLLLAGALGTRGATVLLTVQAASIAGLILAPRTMQPARTAARAAAALAKDGVVLLPRGNDGVGVVGAFAIEAPPALPLLLIRAGETPEQIRARVGGWHRVLLALLEQDDASRAASDAMRRAMTAPFWREVARGPNVAVYERVGVDGSNGMFFEGFALAHVPVPGGTIRLRHGGSGPPLLILHGNPRTHAMWHLVAPELAKRFTVICPDLRGYGFSLKPPATEDHAPYAKREMAKDMIAVMDHFGFEKFRLAGHDRGARLSHRIALDYPDRVERLATLDIIPTLEHFERANMNFGLGYYHWFWFAQKHPYPEWLINKAPEEWWRQHTSRDPSLPDLFHPDALADYFSAVRQPAMVRGMCEDYRAATSIDLVHDRESRANGDKVRCPMLVLWGSKGSIAKWYDAPAIWREYCANDVTGGPIASGHYIAEEAPGELLTAFKGFF